MVRMWMCLCVCVCAFITARYSHYTSFPFHPRPVFITPFFLSSQHNTTLPLPPFSHFTPPYPPHPPTNPHTPT